MEVWEGARALEVRSLGFSGNLGFKQVNAMVWVRLSACCLGQGWLVRWASMEEVNHPGGS